MGLLLLLVMWIGFSACNNPFAPEEPPKATVEITGKAPADAQITGALEEETVEVPEGSSRADVEIRGQIEKENTADVQITGEIKE